MERDFDDQIKQIYNEGGGFEYNPANWDKLKTKLAPSSSPIQSKKMMGLVGIFTFKKILAAASVLLVVGLSTVYYFKQNRSQYDSISSTQSNIETPINNEKKPISSTENRSMSQERSSNNSSITQTKYSNSKSVTVIQNDRNVAKQMNKDEHSTNPKLVDTDPSKIVQNSQIKNEKEFKLLMNDELKDREMPIVKQKEIENKGFNEINPLLNIYNDKSNDNTSSLSNGLSVIGSYGKGLSNSVYAAGLNYEVAISKRFFVDGAVSVYGSSIQNVVSFSAQNEDKLVTTSNSNGTLAVGLLDETNNDLRVQNANYAHVSLNPSFGYKISERLSIKAGLDLQKKITSNNELSYAESNSEYKQLPNIDMGITPKIGIELNRHWQTNLIYRKGINDLIYKKSYYNRSFVQIQLGYKF